MGEHSRHRNNQRPRVSWNLPLGRDDGQGEDDHQDDHDPGDDEGEPEAFPNAGDLRAWSVDYLVHIERTDLDPEIRPLDFLQLFISKRHFAFKGRSRTFFVAPQVMLYENRCESSAVDR